MRLGVFVQRSAFLYVRRCVCAFIRSICPLSVRPLARQSACPRVRVSACPRDRVSVFSRVMVRLKVLKRSDKYLNVTTIVVAGAYIYPPDMRTRRNVIMKYLTRGKMPTRHRNCHTVIIVTIGNVDLLCGERFR